MNAPRDLLKPRLKKSLDTAHRPIGVFDSGLGGLTVVREIQKELAGEDIVYFGDIARLPYGIKSREQIIRFSQDNTEFLLKHKIKALVIACNSSASASLLYLKKRYKIPIIDVIQPAVEAALQQPFFKRIGVIATPATIESGAYERELKKLKPGVKIFKKACPLFVPLVEEGWLGGTLGRQIVAKYLSSLKKAKLDALILGCTHYPLLKRLIRDYLGKKVKFIDSASPTVSCLKKVLASRNLLAKRRKKGNLRVWVSDLPRNFLKVGERFLGRKIKNIKVVNF